MAMSVGELFLKLGFNVDDAKLRGFDTQIVNVKNNLIGVREYAIGAAYAIGRFIDNSLQGTADMKAFNEQTGLSLDTLQDYQNVAQQLNRNLSSGAVLTSIRNLQERITEIQRFGTGDIMPFTALGIDVMSTDAFDTLNQIRDVLSQFDQPTAVNLLKRLGLDPNFISLLKVSNEEFYQMAETLRLTGNQRSNLDELGKTIAQLTVDFQHWKDVVTAELTPSFIEFIGIVKDFSIHIGTIAVQSFQALFKALDKLGGYKYIIYAIAAALVAMTSPVLLTAAAVTSLVLALDELAKWRMGEENAFTDIGNFFKENIGDKLEGFFTPGHRNNIINRLNHAASIQGQPTQAPNTRNQTVNNTFNVHSTGDPLSVGQSIFTTFENSLHQLDNGPVN